MGKINGPWKLHSGWKSWHCHFEGSLSVSQSPTRGKRQDKPTHPSPIASAAGRLERTGTSPRMPEAADPAGTHLPEFSKFTPTPQKNLSTSGGRWRVPSPGTYTESGMGCSERTEAPRSAVWRSAEARSAPAPRDARGVQLGGAMPGLPPGGGGGSGWP